MDAKRESHIHHERCKQDRRLTCDLAGLEVVEEDLEASGLGTVVGDDDARAADDLAGLALTVNLGETGPLAENLGVGDLDELDVVLSAEGLNELRVLGLGDGLDENTEVSLALVESLGGLAETTGKTVVDLGHQLYAPAVKKLTRAVLTTSSRACSTDMGPELSATSTCSTCSGALEALDPASDIVMVFFHRFCKRERSCRVENHQSPACTLKIVPCHHSDPAFSEIHPTVPIAVCGTRHPVISGSP